MKRAALLTLVILAAVTGCQGLASDGTPDGPVTKTFPVHTEVSNLIWGLNIEAHNVSREVGGDFSAYVAIGGQFEGTAYGVKVRFLNEKREIVKEVPVGNISQAGKRWVNTTTPTIPVYVITVLDDWETPDTELVHSTGFKVTADGYFPMYTRTDPSNFTY